MGGLCASEQMTVLFRISILFIYTYLSSTSSPLSSNPTPISSTSSPNRGGGGAFRGSPPVSPPQGVVQEIVTPPHPDPATVP